MPSPFSEDVIKVQTELEEAIDSLNEQELSVFATAYFTGSKEDECKVVNVIYYGEDEDMLRELKLLLLKGSLFQNERLLINNGVEVKVVFYHWETFIPADDPNLIASIILLLENKLTFEHLVNHISIAVEGVPYVKVYGSGKIENEEAFINTIGSICGVVKLNSFDRLLEYNLQQELAPLFEAKHIKYLENFAAFSKIKKNKFLLEEKARQLHLRLKSKNQSNRQSVRKINQLDHNSYGESQILRNKIKGQQDQFEKQFQDFLSKYFAPPLGIFYKEQSQKVGLLNQLTEKKGGRQVTYTIPQQFENDLIEGIKNQSLTAFNKESEQANSFARSIAHEVDLFLKERGRGLQTTIKEVGNKKRWNQILDANVVINRKFEKTSSNRKMMEYFMGARMYYMIIFMGLSMFGLGAGIRSLGYYMIPIGILLVGLGVFQVWSMQQKDKEERKQKNKEDARDFLKGELKTIYSNLSKTWEKEIINNLRGQSERLLGFAEEELKRKEQTEKQKSTQEKEKANSVTKKIDNQLKDFEKFFKTLESIDKRQLQLAKKIKLELAKQFKNQ